jgi:hypothetical protein
MMVADQNGGGFSSIPLFQLQPVIPVETMLENMRSALARGLPQVRSCRAHKHVMSVAAGGPSLEDTHKELHGYIVAMNGSLRWLLERGVTPNACGVLDPGAHMVDIVEADPNVSYFVASICDPALFEKLLKVGCHVVLWHPSGQPECEIVLETMFPDTWFMVGGGCTMGLRWINLGYVCGFRTFKLHGLDSSFRGTATHAYPDRADVKEHLTIDGRQTRLNFVNQVQDFLATIATYDRVEFDPVDIEVYGEGLLQDVLENHLRQRGELPRQRLGVCLKPERDGVKASEIAA